MGLKKTLLYASGLALATGGPITMFSAPDIAESMRKGLTPHLAATATANPQKENPPQAAKPMEAAPALASSSLLPANNASTRPMSADSTPMPSLSEVLRFDVTVEWVMQRWPRVSTGLPHLQLQGYRVPLVSGTSPADVAGSLTYYFNAAQQAQRITLRGTTGDPSQLIGVLTARHRFARRLVNDPGVVLFEAVDASNRPTGSLKIRSAKIVQAHQPLTRFEIDLVMDRTE